MSNMKEPVSKALLKVFGDKCKRIFRSSVSTEGTLGYLVTSTPELNATKDQLVRVEIKGSLAEKDIHSVVVINYVSETVEYQAVNYGTAPINYFYVVLTAERNLAFAFSVSDRPLFISAEVVDLQSENVNLANITPVTEEIGTVICEVEFKNPYATGVMDFSILNKEGSPVNYMYGKQFSEIKTSGEAMKLAQSVSIGLNGASLGSATTNFSDNVQINTVMGPIDYSNCTQYNGVLIDNATGAIEGVNIPQRAWVTTGYPEESATIRPLLKDDADRGYVIIPEIPTPIESNNYRSGAWRLNSQTSAISIPVWFSEGDALGHNLAVFSGLTPISSVTSSEGVGKAVFAEYFNYVEDKQIHFHIKMELTINKENEPAFAGFGHTVAKLGYPECTEIKYYGIVGTSESCEHGLSGLYKLQDMIFTVSNGEHPVYASASCVGDCAVNTRFIGVDKMIMQFDFNFVMPDQLELVDTDFTTKELGASEDASLFELLQLSESYMKEHPNDLNVHLCNETDLCLYYPEF